MKKDYTREEFAEILENTFGMAQGIPSWRYSVHLNVHGRYSGRVEIDLQDTVLSLWSGLGDSESYALEVAADSYRAIERKLTCFYEMLEID